MEYFGLKVFYDENVGTVLANSNQDLTPGFWIGMGSEWHYELTNVTVRGIQGWLKLAKGRSLLASGPCVTTNAGVRGISPSVHYDSFLDNMRAAVICRNVALLDFPQVRFQSV